MTDRTHTPGPWYAVNDCTIRGPHGEPVASTKGFAYPAAVEYEPNARLIAAAPDLLAACDAVLTWARTPGNHGGNPYAHEFVKMAETAIAKVEGR